MASLTIRRWHSYIGLLAAPTVIFFALTGAVQIYGLHEAHGGYHPPAIVEKLSSVHKDQVFALGHHHDAAAPDADAGGPEAGPATPPARPPPKAKDDDDDDTGPSILILKAFFLVVALSLTVSTVFGVWMGVTQTRHPRLSWGLLIAGVLIPLVLVLI